MPLALGEGVPLFAPPLPEQTWRLENLKRWHKYRGRVLCQGTEQRTSMTPKEVFGEWVERFNASDAAGLAELYADDAVNHQVANEPALGKATIRSMLEAEFAAANMANIAWLFSDLHMTKTAWVVRLVRSINHTAPYSTNSVNGAFFLHQKR